MAKKYRLTQNNKTGIYRFEQRQIDFRNVDYWSPVVTPECPQKLADALNKLEQINHVERWEVIA